MNKRDETLQTAIALRVDVAPAIVRDIAAAVAAGGYREDDAATWSDRYGLPVERFEALLRDKTFSAMVLAGVEAKLRTICAPAAVATLQSVLTDTECATKLRITAAKTLLDRAGVVAGGIAPAASAPDTDISEMTADQLHTLVDHLEGELAQRASPVRAPNLNADDADTLESVFSSDT